MEMMDFLAYAEDAKREAKVCPCCGYRYVTFTTDDSHEEYWLQCSRCGVGVRNRLFINVIEKWNRRFVDDERLNKLAEVEVQEWIDEPEHFVKSMEKDRALKLIKELRRASYNHADYGSDMAIQEDTAVLLVEEIFDVEEP